MKRQTGVLLVSIFLISSIHATEANKPDMTSDAGLVTFLQRSDLVMSRTLDRCRDVSVDRSGEKAFHLEATCAIKGNPEGDLDCPDYRIDATGTIDTVKRATIRRLTMTLVCTG